MKVKRDVQKARGKTEPQKDAERFFRNEKKLSDAQREYDTWCGTILQTIEDIIKYSWQDMVPITKHLLQFEHHYFKRVVETRDRLEDVRERARDDDEKDEGVRHRVVLRNIPQARAQAHQSGRVRFVAERLLCKRGGLRQGGRGLSRDSPFDSLG